MRHSSLSVHVNPSPSNKKSHVQLRVPSPLLVQVAFPPHPPLLVRQGLTNVGDWVGLVVGLVVGDIETVGANVLTGFPVISTRLMLNCSPISPGVTYSSRVAVAVPVPTEQKPWEMLARPAPGVYTHASPGAPVHSLMSVSNVYTLPTVEVIPVLKVVPGASSK